MRHWIEWLANRGIGIKARPGSGASSRASLWQAVEAKLSPSSNGDTSPIDGFAGEERRLLEACLAQRGQLDETLRNYLRRWVLQDDPGEAAFAEGKLWEWLGATEEAEQTYRACLARLPSHAKANNQLGLSLLAKERWDEAIACFGRAIASEPGNAVFHNNLGIALWHVGELEDSLSCFRKAWQLDTANPEIRRNLFKAAMELDVLVVAGEVVDDALSAEEAGASGPTASMDKLGVAANDPVWPYAAQAALALQSGDLERAESLYRELLPKEVSIGLTGLGMVSLGRGEFAAAATSFHEVVERSPENPAALYNLAIACVSLGDPVAALDLLDRALAKIPDDPRFLFMRATLCLQLGRWEEGWRDYEARLRFGDHLAQCVGFDPDAIWRGEALRGKTLAIVGEQGAGDQIQFVRFAAQLAESGAEVVAYCDRALQRLFESVPGVARVCASGDPFISYDFWIPMLSLPSALHVDGASLPAKVPYLFPDPGRRQFWRERLRPSSGLKVGLVWGGNPAYGKKGGGLDRRRSLPLDALAPLWGADDVAVFSLQKGPPREQLAGFKFRHRIADNSDEWLDYADTAAFIAELDLVISVDTSVAHLAGALGKPVWILSRYDACWRWMENREDSPWYPSARLFRQGPFEGWGPVVRRVADALSERAGEQARVQPLEPQMEGKSGSI